MGFTKIDVDKNKLLSTASLQKTREGTAIMLEMLKQRTPPPERKYEYELLVDSLMLIVRLCEHGIEANKIIPGGIV